jgi:uncharacterized protein (TIGR00369 family)
MATKEEISAFLARDFPQAARGTVEAAGNGGATIRYRIDHDALRPGGTVSGPVLFTVADLALYVAVLGDVGIVPLAVTTNLNINFLRKPAADRDVIGVCRLLKVGRLLAIGEVTLYSDGSEDPVAHATGTYAIPPARA